MADDMLLPLLDQNEESNSSDENEEEEEMEGEEEACNRESTPGDGVGSSHQEREPISYDTTLPTLHQYLGTDLEELSGRTVLDADSCQTLPLLALPRVVLVPGQTLPLQLFRPALVAMMRHVIQHDRTFGLVNSRMEDSVSSLASVGTTAEIRSFREEPNESFGFSMLRVKAEGRQRFEILETRQQADGMIMAKVRILPEIVLGDPGSGIRLACLDRYRIPPPTLRRDSFMINGNGILTTSKQRRHGRYNFASYTWWPPWVYKQYDPGELVKRIQRELRGWNRSFSPTSEAGEREPVNPVEFSFWVAANLPLDDSLRLNLLAFNCAVQRLRCELSILEKYTLLCCQECSAEIAQRADVFSMSREGPQGTYVNPNGYVHETVTVYKARGLTLVGRPSTEHSWFPGYAWTIVQCRQCSNHMGWRFTATENLKPETFWGLCRSAMLPGISGDDERWRPLL